MGNKMTKCRACEWERDWLQKNEAKNKTIRMVEW